MRRGSKHPLHLVIEKTLQNLTELVLAKSISPTEWWNGIYGMAGKGTAFPSVATLCLPESKENDAAMSVSYTHLDVYKRQAHTI